MKAISDAAHKEISDAVRKTMQDKAHEAIKQFAEEHAGLSLNDITEGNNDLLDGLDGHFLEDSTWLTNDGVFGTNHETWGAKGLQNIRLEDAVDHYMQPTGAKPSINLQWRIRATIDQAILRGFILGRKYERERESGK